MFIIILVFSSIKRLRADAEVERGHALNEGSELSAAVKGAMYSPAYGVMPSESRPGTMRPFDAEQRPKMPSIARRPLLISARSAFALRSGVIFFVKPKGSKRLSGSGCGQNSSLKKPLKGG